MNFYQLKPKMPGGFWLTVFIMAVGIGMIIASLTTTSKTLSITGCVVTIVALILMTAIVISTMTQRVLVTFDDQGYTVESPRGEFHGSWLDVTDVSVSRTTGKLALWHGPDRRTIIAHPARVMDHEFMMIREEIRTHLEKCDSGDDWDG